MSSETPPWLKSAQNGSIGEARTRAFLLDRFWVLERSVDVDGADFIIQRRLTRQALRNRDAPRFGVIQVKFLASEGTTQYVHQEYVRDDEGKPRAEFFLICHTGDEESARAFLITATEIVETFELVDDGVHANKYRIGGAQLLRGAKFEISSRKRALDRIEHTLEMADFVKNRSFVSWLLPSARLDAGAIDPIYREPIENYWGNIPEAFLNLKRAAQRGMLNLEEIYEMLKGIVETTNPESAFDLVERIAYRCRSGYGWHVSLPGNLKDPDFESVVREHRMKVMMLKERGLLDAFIDFKEAITREFVRYLAPMMPLTKEKAHVVDINYDPISLRNVTVGSKIESAKLYDGSSVTSSRGDGGFIDASPGRIQYWWIPGVFAIDQDVAKEGWEAYVRRGFWTPYRDVMDALHVMHCGEVG